MANVLAGNDGSGAFLSAPYRPAPAPYRAPTPAPYRPPATNPALAPRPFNENGAGGTYAVHYDQPNFGLTTPEQVASFLGLPGNAQYGSGGYTAPTGAFDFTTDPTYQAALAQQQLGLAQLQNNLKAQAEQAVIGFGDPALLGQISFGYDPQAADFAHQNYLSGNATLARLDKQHDLNRKAIINQLAGRGLLFSGDTGYQEGQADQAYGNDVYDARQKVLQLLSGLQGNYLSASSSAQSSLLQALLAAFASASQNPGVAAGGQIPIESAPSAFSPTYRQPVVSTRLIPKTAALRAHTITGGF